MIELKALNLHWLESMKEEVDKCAHSSVYLKIDKRIISDENFGIWTVSSSAFYFLKALREIHNENSPSQLLPCCGFNMWILGDNANEPVILGCPSGINWTIIPAQNKVTHQFEDGEIIETNFNEWRNAVCKFSDEVMNFYKESLPKIIDDEEDKKGFELFMKEWKRLRAEAFE